MATDDRNIEPENRLHTVHILSRHIDDALRYQRDFGNKQKSIYLWAFIKIGKLYGAYVTLLYCFVKVLYLLNVIGQFVLLNRFLETADYPFFGAHIVWDLLRGMEWQNSGKFPRVTLCDFDIRVLGNIHRHTVQCVLVINMFTEKIFIFLWIWFLAVTVVTSVSFLFYTVTLLIPSVRINFVMKYLDLSDAPPDRTKDKKHLHRFVVRFLRPDGVFILRSVAANSGTILSTELIYSLWLRYRESLKLPRISEELDIDKVPFEKLDSGGEPIHVEHVHYADEEMAAKQEAEPFTGSAEDVPWKNLPPAPPPPKLPLLGNHKGGALGRFLPEPVKNSPPPPPPERPTSATGDEDDGDEGELHYA